MTQLPWEEMSFEGQTLSHNINVETTSTSVLLRVLVYLSQEQSRITEAFTRIRKGSGKVKVCVEYYERAWSR